MAPFPIDPRELATLASAPGAPFAVQLERVSKRFGDSLALDDVSLRIHEGEFVTLIGPSGCGKTTLLNLLAGLCTADQGQVILDGQWAGDAHSQLGEIGIVNQHPPQWDAQLAGQSIAASIGDELRRRDVGETEIIDRVAQVLTLVRLHAHAERPFRDLSGGERQRAALAQALAIRPRLLLLDEPFAGLEKPLRLAMQIELKDLQRRLGMTTVCVTHDQGEALSLSDRVVVMRAGRVHQAGPPDAIYRYPQDPFVARFVGDVNVLPSRYLSRDERAKVSLGDSVLRLPAEQVQADVGARLDLYLRPEHIHLEPLGADTRLSATVVAHVFQGDHVDIQLDAPALGPDRLLARQPGSDAQTRWPVGAVAGLSIDSDGACAFAVDAQPGNGAP
ncbi:MULTISPECIES: ABC transporter ATP-binding protein [unclassified Pseudomonas]|uniref:ABC transporter ATP-binding protein n=1 Tax=unclassified Pseudomonas TaxID=196821 RepID=UPI000D3D87C3|nr:MULTISPECIES: ABC transporter ATP-binding protein [unclassified Pseudomonas]RAU44624.1 ABC transporter ATP-binding protein [Pseudomonas sp. RIT 409]RAU54940.1 ABC transporter ATP-binding protein [Pseudomonas sp. RIT 412]